MTQGRVEASPERQRNRPISVVYQISPRQVMATEKSPFSEEGALHRNQHHALPRKLKPEPPCYRPHPPRRAFAHPDLQGTPG